MNVYFKLAVLWTAQIAMGSRKSVQIRSANLTLKLVCTLLLQTFQFLKLQECAVVATALRNE